MYDETDVAGLLAEVKKLRSANRELQTDLRETQTHCDEAVAGLVESEKILRESSALRQQLIETQAQSDDFRRRLEICSQANADLTTRLQQTKVVMEQSRQEEVLALKNEIGSAQSAAETETTFLKKKIRDAQESTIHAQSESSILRTQLLKLVNAANGYFHAEFDGPSPFLDFLLRPPASESSPPVDPQFERQMKKLRTKLDSETKQRKQLELEVLQLRQAAQTEAVAQSTQLSQFQEHVRSHAIEVKKMEEQHEKAIAALQDQLRQSKQLRSVSTQVVAMGDDDPLSVRREKQATAGKLVDAQHTIFQLEQQVARLQQTTVDQANVTESLSKKLSKEQTKGSQLYKDLKEAQKQIRSLESEIEQFAQNQHNFEARESQATDIQKNFSHEIKKLNRALELVNSKIRSQGEELDRTVKDRAQLVSLVHKYAGLLAAAEKLLTQNAQGGPTKTESTPVAIISDEPLHWDFGTLPTELVSILRTGCEHGALPLDARIRHGFAIVAKWIHKLEQTHTNELQAANQETENVGSILNDFTSALTTIFEKKSLDRNQIIAEVNELQKANFRLRQQMHVLETDHKVIFDRATYEQLQSTIASLQHANDQLTTKSKRRRIELRECKAAFQSIRAQCDGDLQTVRIAHERAEATIAELRNEIHDLQHGNASLRAEINECKEAQDAEYAKHKAELETVLADQSAQYDELRGETTARITEQREMVTALQTRVNELTETSHRLAEQLEQSQEDLKERESANRRLLAKLEKKDGHAGHVFDELEAKYDEIKTALDETTAVLSEKEETIRRLTAQLDQMDFALKKAKLQSQSRIDHLERQKKLLEVQSKTRLIACETEHSVERETIRKQYETEKRALHAFLAEQFQMYFDPSRALDDDGCREIISRIKKDFERHHQQEVAIRKLARAQEGQTTAEALMDLVLSNREDSGASRHKRFSDRRM
jgi:chromosome segregation ATPase